MRTRFSKNRSRKENRGRRESRVLAAPAASLAKLDKAHERSHHRFRRIQPGLPRAMVLTAYFVLSPATNSSCHRHPRIKGLYQARSGRLASADLTPATGARTTRLCRPRQPVSAKGFDGPSAVRPRAIRQLTGLVDPPCHPLTSPDAAASTASRSTLMTCATPLFRDGTAMDLEVIWGEREGKYFCKGDWTDFGGRTDLPVRQNQQTERSACFAVAWAA